MRRFDLPTLGIAEGRGHAAFQHTLGRFEMQRITGYQISDPDNAASILEGYAAAAEGNYDWFRRYLYFYGPDISFGGMPQAMDITSGISPERLVRVEAQADTALLGAGDALNFPMPHLRGAISGIDLGEDFRAPFTSDRPALILSGTLDGRAYPEAHAAIAEGFSNGAVVTIENAGHNLFFSHPEIVEIIAHFFDGAPARSRTLIAPQPSFVNDP